MMNGSLYEDSPPPPPTAPTIPPPSQPPQGATTPNSIGGVTSPGLTNNKQVTNTTSTTSSTSPSSVTSNNGSGTGPLHIPAKRPSTYGTGDCVDPAGGVIRHGHGQTWSYSPADHGSTPSFEPTPGLNHHQYNNTPTYYNLATEDRKPGTALSSFWPPTAASAAASAGGNTDYKYDYKTASAGPSTDPLAVSSCHQNFSAAAQSCWNYSPYSSTRGHHVDAHHHPHQPVPYLTTPDDRGTTAAVAAMAAADAFRHEGYGIGRNYAPDPVQSSPYPPPGKYFYFMFFSCSFN